MATCNNCCGIFQQNYITNGNCLFCINRMDLQKELEHEKLCRMDLEDKFLVLEAKVRSLSDCLDGQNHKISNSQSKPIHREWTTVNRKTSLKRHSNIEGLPIKTRNIYETLSNYEDMDDTFQTIIIGDSQTRNIGIDIHNSKKKKSKKRIITHCYPGADSNILEERIYDLNLTSS